MRSGVSSRPLVISVAIAPRSRMRADDGVQIGMQGRLAAAQRDDGGAEIGQAIDSRRASFRAAPDRNVLSYSLQ